jgi:microcystin degradation protein MlrC
VINIYQGNTITGLLKLRLVDPCDPKVMSSYPLKTTDKVEIKFPSTTPGQSVVLSTANPGEVTMLLDGGGKPTGDVTFNGDTTKGALLNPGLKQTVTFVVTDTVAVPNTVYTGEDAKSLNVLVAANP